MRRRLESSLFVLPFLFSTVLLWQGCGGGAAPDNRPKRTPASGTVTYNGSPVAGATVTLRPTAMEGSGAAGMTDANGKFTLSTFESNDGALPGEYIVLVTKIKVDTPQAAVSEDDPAYSGAPEVTTPPKEQNELPAKYEKENTSDLRATIGDSPVNDLKFDLVD